MPQRFVPQTGTTGLDVQLRSLCDETAIGRAAAAALAFTREHQAAPSRARSKDAQSEARADPSALGHNARGMSATSNRETRDVDRHCTIGRGADDVARRDGDDRLITRRRRTLPLSGRCHARQDGFDLHAGVPVPAGERERFERVCRYALRASVAQDRLSLTVVLWRVPESSG